MFATAAELATLMRQDVVTASADLVLSLVQADLVDAAGVQDETTLPGIAKGIGLWAAARAYSNPAGLTSDALDDYRRNFGGNMLTDDERARLSTSGGSPAGAFTITPFGYGHRQLLDEWQSTLP